jgi:hypothetical protein
MCVSLYEYTLMSSCIYINLTPFMHAHMWKFSSAGISAWYLPSDISPGVFRPVIRIYNCV